MTTTFTFNLDDIAFHNTAALSLNAETIQAALKFGVKTVSVAGGVSANSELRRKFEQACAEKNLTLHIPKPIYSTDNAAMIANLARLKAERGQLEKHLRYNYPAFAAFQG